MLMAKVRDTSGKIILTELRQTLADALGGVGCWDV
jgi:hypothetical protein